MVRALVLLLIAGLSAADELPFRVVVHSSNPTVSITRAELSAIYLKRTRSWGDGREIIPVNQPAVSRLRERFCHAVHGKSVAYVTRYWQRLIFSGRAVPPRELRSDGAVLEFVRANPEAVGYVDPGTPLGTGVRVLVVTR